MKQYYVLIERLDHDAAKGHKRFTIGPFGKADDAAKALDQLKCKVISVDVVPTH